MIDWLGGQVNSLVWQAMQEHRLPNLVRCPWKQKLLFLFPTIKAACGSRRCRIRSSKL